LRSSRTKTGSARPPSRYTEVTGTSCGRRDSRLSNSSSSRTAKNGIPNGSSRTLLTSSTYGDLDAVVAAATYVEDHGFTPFDALHLVESNGDTIVSSDDSYEGVTSRLDLKSVDEE